jgi:uncharacterized membrane protein YczE
VNKKLAQSHKLAQNIDTFFVNLCIWESKSKIMFEAFKVKKIPRLFWSSEKTFTLIPKPLPLFVLLLGLFLFGFGEALLVVSGVGMSPWTVLADGIAAATGWTIGVATFVVSSCVLLLWLPLRQLPGIGTILNVLVVAAVIEFFHLRLPSFDSLPLQILEACAGVLIAGVGGGVYLIANLGPGPRDGLMTGLQKVSNLPLAVVRSGIEISVVSIGWILGGGTGIGTLLFAFGIGPSISVSMYFLLNVFSSEG